MQNADTQVLQQLAAWIRARRRCWLATVVKTWGSSPRPVGSLLACNDTGEVVGSLSGGCVEDDLLEKLADGHLATTTPEVLVYGATTEESERLGLPCGGQLHIVIEPMPDQRHLPNFDQICARLADRACIERRLDLATGNITIQPRERFRHLELIGDFADTAAANSNNNSSTATSEKTLVHTYGPRYQLLLIGAGQVSQYLAEMAQALDYQVLVCDPRQHMTDQWPIPGVQLLTAMPDDAVRDHAVDHFSAVIALTHDPRIDDMALMEALKTDAFFIGAMGSDRTSAKRRERLQLLDLAEAEIARLHAPVGLPIGSKTPAEIAIAILAQLTALRSGQATLPADFRTAASS